MLLIPQTSAGIEIEGQDLRIAVVRDFAGKRRLVYTETVSSLTEAVCNKLRGLNVAFLDGLAPPADGAVPARSQHGCRYHSQVGNYGMQHHGQTCLHSCGV